jgi:hypothetical protein
VCRPRGTARHEHPVGRTTTVPGVWHPVGELPAAVYWRRRLVVLAILLAILGGGGWLGFALATGRIGGGSSGTAAEASQTAVRTPALERVVPSLTGVRTPTAPASTTAAPRPTAAAAAPGGACTDEMIALTVRAPATVAVGSKPTLELVVRNAAEVPCVRELDKALQEIVLLDGAGRRLWGSNDCFPEAGPDTRTLAPGATVAFPLVWGGLTSEPTCTAPRTPPSPGTYVLRGRLDTKISTDTPVTLR